MKQITITETRYVCEVCEDQFIERVDVEACENRHIQRLPKMILACHNADVLAGTFCKATDAYASVISQFNQLGRWINRTKMLEARLGATGE